VARGRDRRAARQRPPADRSQQDQPQRIAAYSLAKTERTAQRGPLARPEILERYEQLAPGSAKLMIDLFGQQAQHRMGIERSVLAGDQLRANLGLSAGWSRAVMFLVGAVVLGLNGQPGLGGVIAGVDMVSLGPSRSWPGTVGRQPSSSSTRISQAQQGAELALATDDISAGRAGWPGPRRWWSGLIRSRLLAPRVKSCSTEYPCSSSQRASGAGAGHPPGSASDHAEYQVVGLPGGVLERGGHVAGFEVGVVFKDLVATGPGGEQVDGEARSRARRVSSARLHGRQRRCARMSESRLCLESGSKAVYKTPVQSFEEQACRSMYC